MTSAEITWRCCGGVGGHYDDCRTGRSIAADAADASMEELEAAAEILEHGQQGEMAPIRRVTMAPEAYDGFGTRTVRRMAGRAWRLVEIPHAAQVNDWQVQRYGSGLYGVFTVDAFEAAFPELTGTLA